MAGDTVSALCNACGTATVHGWLLQCDACFTEKWVRLGVLPKPKKGVNRISASNGTRGSAEHVQLSLVDEHIARLSASLRSAAGTAAA